MGRIARRAVWCSAAAAAALVGVGLLLCKQQIAESYYLGHLERGTRDDRVIAAERLGAMRSVRAVPSLLHVIEEECTTEEQYGLYDCEEFLQPFSQIGESALPALIQRLRPTLKGGLDDSTTFLAALCALERAYRHEAHDEIDVTAILSDIASDARVSDDARAAASAALATVAESSSE